MSQENTVGEMRLGDKPFVIVEYDDKTREFRVIRNGTIPHNELIGLLQRLVVGTCMEANMAAIQKAAQQQTLSVEPSATMPPPPKFQKAR